MPISCSSLTLSVSVMVALCAKGLAAVPTSSSPCTMIHSVLSARSDWSAKRSLPMIVMPFSDGGLTSSTTSLPAAMVTTSPCAGTAPPAQVDLADHFPLLVAVGSAWALVVMQQVASNETRSEMRWLLV
jgi:hypothetical protein